MTNIDGHNLANCGGLLWLGATSTVLPMCHVHVAVFALGCEATIFLPFLKFPKKSHKFFGAYLRQICKKPSLPSSKIFIFLFCSEQHFVKEVLWHVQIVSIFYGAFLCPNNHPPPNASSIHSLFWAQLQHSYLCPVWYFAKQVPPRLLLLSWKFVKTVFLVTNRPQPKLMPISNVHFPYS